MITGTFLDEISRDIPSANWGHDEWTRDFAAMKADGIDTVILSRAGLRDRATFDSQVLRRLHGHLLVQEDLAALFLQLAEQHGMSLWFGTYDSGDSGKNGGQRKDADVDKAFVNEVWERYGRSSAFRGWYISRELDALDERAMKACEGFAHHLRQLSGLPILVSPCIQGSEQQYEPRTLAEKRTEWERIFARIKGHADVVLIREGPTDLSELPQILAANAELAHKYALTSWSNVESFDRDVHIKYPPIAWPKLRYKMETALAARLDKLITFEYSHFLSPNSMFMSAHALHRRYREWLATQR